MNNLVAKHKPSDISAEEWRKVWGNAFYTLEPLGKALEDLIKEAGKVKRTDFDCPNHYARLAYDEGVRTAYQNVLAMLPTLKERDEANTSS